MLVIGKILTTQVVIATLVGSVVMTLVGAFGSLTTQLGVLGSFVCILGGLVLEILEDQNAKDRQIASLNLLFRFAHALAKDSVVSEEFEKIVAGIELSLNIDQKLFRELALEQLKQIGQVSESLGKGVISFEETEAWRLAYEKILRDDSVRLYYSVSLIESTDYWQDEPGKRSIELNYQLQDEKGLNIERIAIIDDSLWEVDSTRPQQEVFNWLFDQYRNGIWIELVRKSSILDEPDLLVDFGQYGDIAVGHQLLDSKSRTSLFRLSFNKDDIETANQRWKRLTMFTVSMREILDQNQSNT